MPLKKVGARRRKRADLTEPEYWELVLGPTEGSVFTDDAERKAAWRDNRDQLLADWPYGRSWAQRRYQPSPS